MMAQQIDIEDLTGWPVPSQAEPKRAQNRETWLEAVAARMEPWFGQLPALRFAIGFPSTGKRGARIGECWDGVCSDDGRFEVLIRPDLAEPVEVAAVLAHELVHAAVGLKAGHGPAFRTMAKAIGLEGKMTATVAGEAFKRAVAPILAEVGPLPHARLRFGLSSGPKKQAGRLLKACCPECGYTIRVTRKWLEEGAPLCPVHHVALVESGAEPVTVRQEEGEPAVLSPVVKGIPLAPELRRLLVAVGEYLGELVTVEDEDGFVRYVHERRPDDLVDEVEAILAGGREAD